MTKINRIILYIQALFWFVLASIYFQRFQEWIIPLLLVIDGFGFFLLALFYVKHPAVRILALLYLAFNILLTVTDQMGFWDFTYLALGGVSALLIGLEIWQGRKKK